MATSSKRTAQRGFVTDVLPWLIGAGGLLVYLATLNSWVSLASLGFVARISGLLWQPELSRPLTWAVVFPFRALPQGWIPLALNIFNAGCAALTLVLLARSVALFPHDLPHDDRFRKGQQTYLLGSATACIPPVLAAMVCGLQLSFWEQATCATGQMIDLLAFAYIIRCLLEFRIDQDQSWLSRCALVYGAAMANNWAMIGFFPVFLAALLRTIGLLRLLKLSFLRRMLLWGLAGVSLYLLLPAVCSLSPQIEVGFWAALKANLGSQKILLSVLRQPTFRTLAVVCLLPLLVLSVRWKSQTLQFADDSRLGLFLTRAAVRFVQALFLLVSLWLALDPNFSPRHLSSSVSMLGFYCLACYYIWAMVAGYCAGYFLVSSPLIGSRGSRRHGVKPAVVAICILVCALPLGLTWRNLGQIRVTNGPAVRQFARELYSDLPAGRSVVLSDDAVRLLLLRTELGAHDRTKQVLPLDMRSLTSAQYQILMARQFKSRWPVSPPTNRLEVITPGQVVKLVSEFALWERVICLQPSYSQFFEGFTGQPNGSIHCLSERRMQGSTDARLSELEVAGNEQLWQQRWGEHLQALAELTKEEPQTMPRRSRSLAKLLRLAAEKNSTAVALGAAYSKSLDDWGVDLQRVGRWREAEVWFERALALNPGNLAAGINLEYNRRWQRGERNRLDEALMQKEFGVRLAQYRTWGEALNSNGSFDEPTLLLYVGRALMDNREPRQAAREFSRCAELAPDWLGAKLWLMASHLNVGEFADALAQAQSVESSCPPRDAGEAAQLLFCRTTALEGLGRNKEATACIESFVRQYRERSDVLSIAATLYAENTQPEECLIVLDPLLQRRPNDSGLLAQKGFAELQLSRYDDAVGSLTRALSSAPRDAALHRALSNLLAGQFDAVRSDSKKLLEAAGSAQNLLIGLGEIAWRKGDTNAAMAIYRQYLSNIVPGSPHSAVAAERLQQLSPE